MPTLMGNLKLRFDSRLPPNILAAFHPDGRLDMFEMMIGPDGGCSWRRLHVEEAAIAMLGVKTPVDMDLYLQLQEAVVYLQEIQASLNSGDFEAAHKGLAHLNRIMNQLKPTTRGGNHVANMVK